MHGHGGAAKMVEGDVEPAVDVAVHGMIAVAQLARGDAFLQRLCLGCGAVFIRAADVERLVTGKPAIASEHIRGKHLDEVSQVGDVVHVGQRGSDQIVFPYVRLLYRGRPGASRTAAFRRRSDGVQAPKGTSARFRAWRSSTDMRTGTWRLPRTVSSSRLLMRKMRFSGDSSLPTGCGT